MPNMILEAAVRSTLIALCTGAMLFTLRVRAPRLRHAVWAGVVALMLALPLWTQWGPKATVRVPPRAADSRGIPAPVIAAELIAAEPLAATGNRAGAAIRPAVAPPAFPWQSVLAAIYFVGLCALLARLAIGTLRAHSIIRRAGTREGRLTSDACAVPVTVGLVNPAVILPACWRDWPQAQLHAVLTHEDEHARRRDPLVQWLALLNRAIFWFHPLAWWLERRLSALSEEACDAAVLQRGHDPFAYSEYLMEMARAMQRSGARVNFIAMAMPGASLPQRIRLILEAAPVPRISRMRMACMAIACAAVSALFTAGAVDYSPRPAPAQAAAVRAGTQPAVIPAPPQPLPVRPRIRPRVLLAQAQSAAASLSGTVEDPSGGRIVHCRVILRDQAGAEVETVFSDAAGVYRFASLAPGRYSLQFAVPGFAQRTIQRVDIGASQPAHVDAALELGQVKEMIIISAPRPAPAPAIAPTARAEPKSGPIAIGGKVQAAHLTKHPPAVYPPELREQGIEGTVRVRALIGEDGILLNPHVLNFGEVDSRFVEAALDSLRQWRYEPAKLNEHPVDTMTTIDVMFQLGN